LEGVYAFRQKSTGRYLDAVPGEGGNLALVTKEKAKALGYHYFLGGTNLNLTIIVTEI
jgi:hypothetical protein